MLNNNGLKFIQGFLATNDRTNEITVQLTRTEGYDTSFRVVYTNAGVLGWAPAAQNGSNSDAGYRGGLYYLSNGTTVYYGSSSMSGGDTWGVHLGDGDTAPALTDIQLSGNRITNFSGTTTVSNTVSGNHISIIATYNITNTGGTPFTVKEYGVFIKNNFGYSAMIARGLLDSPLTLNAGESGVISINLTLF